jgi:hypothetical protein
VLYGVAWIHDCHSIPERGGVMDFIFFGAIVGFFALSADLIHFCAGLMDKGGRP